jgi:hypothetical protein
MPVIAEMLPLVQRDVFRKMTFPITDITYPSDGLEPVHPAGDIPEFKNARFLARGRALVLTCPGSVLRE